MDADPQIKHCHSQYPKLLHSESEGVIGYCVVLNLLYLFKFNVMQLPYAVYIVKCHKGHYYTGFTRDIAKRLKGHRQGHVRATKDKLPIALVYFCLFANKQKVYDFERYLKSGSGIAFRNKRLI